jgi:O-6-methylguanine DNA methyltransferase
MTTEFAQRVFDVVRTIPRGQTMTYKQVAVAAGRPKAFRAVGNILNTNYHPEIPCHRVVRSDGKTGGYNRGAQEKARKLKAEQVDA